MNGAPVSFTAEEARFATLVRDHQAGLYRYLRYLGCRETEAEDFVQETFLRVWRRPPEDRGPVAVSAWLRTVARNLVIDAARRARVRPAFRDVSELEVAWREVERDDGGEGYRAALRACLSTLTERARRALAIFYGEGRSREDVGAALAMTADGVKTLLRRSRESLRECIEGRLSS